MKFGKPIFIISPVKRSGTNYLKNILCQHKDCFSPGPIWEDELLRKAYLLSDYIDFTFDKWNPDWNVETDLMSRQQVLGSLGTGLIEVLHAQFYNSEEKRSRFVGGDKERSGRPYRYVTKTPQAENISLLPLLFPEAYLLILVRDGRAAARSGETSFSKPFDCAVREWGFAMDEIEGFIKSPFFNPCRHRILRYEDLVENPAKHMRELMSFLDLDTDGIALDKLDSMPVVGSSTLRAEGSDMHWKPMGKLPGFAPLDRAQELGLFRQSHFSYLTGARGHFAGYEFPPVQTALRPLHALRSAFWWPVWIGWQRSRFILEDGKRVWHRIVRGGHDRSKRPREANTKEQSC